jgi:hypothetical protein
MSFLNAEIDKPIGSQVWGMYITFDKQHIVLN